ncbi:chlorohydrolase [Streptococcus pneumoniae]|nr:chlorohydrolase [Streptococcus pneumoniae]
MTQYPFFYFENLYSMKIKEQTRKLAAGCSKHCFEVRETDEAATYNTARQS